MTRLTGTFVCALLLLGFGKCNFAFAQTIAETSAPQPRITQEIDESKMVRLTGNTHPMAQNKYDMGLVSRDLPMERMQLLLKRSPAQEAALEKFMTQQYDPKSPNFHHWLHAKEFGEKYGPSDSDIAAVTGWLQRFGFRVDNVSKGRVTIEFSGTAAQVEQAFHTEIHHYSVNGTEHIANSIDPQIPQALAPVIGGIVSLHDFFSKPQSVFGHKVKRNKKTGQYTLADSPSGISPQLGFTDGNDVVHQDVSPFDFATIYNELPLWNSGIDGTGIAIAITARSDVTKTDVSTFRSTFGLPTNPFTVIHNGTDPGLTADQGENTLDVEWSGAAAPKASIILVVSASTATSDGVDLSDAYIIDNEVAAVMSASYGQCELFLGTSGNSAVNALWQQGAAEGITIFNSSGDQGSAACDGGQQAPDAASFGLQVNGLSTSPFVTSIGGTDFLWQNNEAKYWNATNSSTGANATGYIPEIPWNSSCASAFLVSISVDATPEAFCNDVLNEVNYVGLDFLVNVVGGGGGKSACTAPTSNTAASCAGGYAKPSWQTGIGVPADGKRDIPDVSLFASDGYGDAVAGSAYLMCLAAQSPDGTCNYNNPDFIIYQEVGGTSVASPAMAGIMALVLQSIGSPQGVVNPILYPLAAGENLTTCNSNTVVNGSACIFYDSTSGTNAEPCIPSTTNCVTKTSGDQVGILSGNSTTKGYDLATGLGSVNAANLVNAWANAIGEITFTPTSLTFPSTQVGVASAAQTITLKNSGHGVLSIFSIGFGGANPSSYSGTTTCPAAPATLAAAASCTVSVTFKPTASGSLPAQLEVFDNTIAQPQTVNLTGTGSGGSNPPVVSLTPASVAFASTKVGATSAAKTVTLKNTGGSTLNINSGGISITGANASSFVENSTTCGSTVAAGASCTISLSFKPAVAGALTASLSIADNAAGSPQTVSLSGTGTASAGTVTLTPISITFPKTKVGASSVPHIVTLKNTGGSTVTINSGGITITGTNASSFTKTTTCGSTVATGATCTISVTFSPTTSGTLTATLNVADNATGSPQTVSLKGTVAPPAVTLSPTTVTFANTKVGSTSATKTVTVKNTGGAPLTINSGGITISGANASSFVKNSTTCGSSVAAGASCTISLSFKPTTGGTLTATLNVADNAAGSPQKVTLTGTVPPPAVSLTPIAVTFASTAVGTTSAAKTVTLKNTGGSALTINTGGLTISGANASSFTKTTTCGSTVAVGASCTISVSFKPTTTGSLIASLNVADNAAGSPQAVSLTGTGK